MTTTPAWTCPKCGATHPITATTCCGPAAFPWVPPPDPATCDACRCGVCDELHVPPKGSQ